LHIANRLFNDERQSPQINPYFYRNMKLLDVLVLSLAVAFLIIAIHQTMVAGFQKAYWLLMIALILYFVYNLRKKSKS
jgi:amino acid permease